MLKGQRRKAIYNGVHESPLMGKPSSSQRQQWNFSLVTTHEQLRVERFIPSLARTYGIEAMVAGVHVVEW